MNYNSGDKVVVRVTGSKKTSDQISEKDGIKTVRSLFLTEGVSTKGDVITFWANEPLNGRTANLQFRKAGDEYIKADGTKANFTKDSWNFTTAGSAGDLSALKADLSILKDLGF